jgi:hypothetical protein
VVITGIVHHTSVQLPRRIVLMYYSTSSAWSFDNTDESGCGRELAANVRVLASECVGVSKNEAVKMNLRH